VPPKPLTDVTPRIGLMTRVPWLAARVRLATLTVEEALAPGVTVTVPLPTRATWPRAWLATALLLLVNVRAPARLTGVEVEMRWLTWPPAAALSSLLLNWSVPHG